MKELKIFEANPIRDVGISNDGMVLKNAIERYLEYANRNTKVYSKWEVVPKEPGTWLSGGYSFPAILIENFIDSRRINYPDAMRNFLRHTLFFLLNKNGAYHGALAHIDKNRPELKHLSDAGFTHIFSLFILNNNEYPTSRNLNRGFDDSIITHEYTHYFDELRYTPTWKRASNNYTKTLPTMWSKKDAVEYTNSSHEMQAFFIQALHSMNKLLQKPRNRKKYLRTFPIFAKKFILFMEFNPLMQKKNRRKLLTRIYKIYMLYKENPGLDLSTKLSSLKYN